MRRTLVSTLLGMLVALSASSASASPDVDAAKALAKQNNCMKCHGLDKDKDGPSFKKTAEKFKGKADAEAKLVKHLTTGPKVKLPDGSEEEHKKVGTKDEAAIKNLVQYILAQ